MELVIASIFNFGLVVFILWFFGRKSIAAFLVARAEAVSTAMTEAERQSKESGALLSEWETNSRSREAHAKAQFEEAKAAIARSREIALVAAGTEAERVKNEAALVGKSETSRVKETLRRELVDRSVTMAHAYLEGNLSEKDRQKLVTEYVEKVTDATA